MKISLIQWNILYSEPIANIINFLKQNPADIYCLQELTSNLELQYNFNGPAEIAKVLQYNYCENRIPLIGFTTKTKFILGNGIFTRFDILNTKEVTLQKRIKPSSYSNEERKYIEADLDVSGKILTVGTTHLSYTKRFINNARRQRETDNLINVIKEKRQHYILTGDFNSVPGSYTVKTVESYLKHAGPAYSQKTFPTRDFEIDNFNAGYLDWRLDYVFATPDIKVTKAEVLKTDYSDHLPVRVEFEV